MNGADILGGDAARAKKVMSALLRRAAEARRDPKKFFDFVMVTDDATKRHVKADAHQRVILDFLNEHYRGVLMVSRGHSKTFCMAAYILWMIGNDPNFRGVVIGITQEAAEKIIKAVRDYIETSERLRLVFPDMVRSPNKFDPWTQSSLTVKRQGGSRDPTLKAFGIYGPIRGARLKAVFVDDVLDDENVHTDEQRKKVITILDGAVRGTLDTTGGTKMFLVGTTLHPEDCLHVAREKKWACLEMNVVGDITLQDDEEEWNRVNGGDEWDHPDLAPSDKHPDDPTKLQIAGHAPGEILWPQRFGIGQRGEKLDTDEALRRILKVNCNKNPIVFQREYMMIAVDQASAWCRREWVDKCELVARQKQVFRFAGGYAGEGLVFMGVDLGLALGEHNDDTAFFVALVHDTGHRQILHIEAGKYDGAQKMRRVAELCDRFRVALCIVEGNGGQRLLAEWTLNENIALPVKAVETGKEKTDVHLGIPGLFTEIFNGAWLFPNEGKENKPPEVERVERECVGYVPDRHTGDVLMAMYCCWKGMRMWGVTTGGQAVEGGGDLGSFMQR